MPRGRAEAATFGFAWNPNPRTSIPSCGNAHLYVFGLRQRAFAFAERTGRPSLPRAPTVQTLLRETQSAAGALHLAGSFARLADHHRPPGITCTVAARTLLGTIDTDAGRKSFDSFIERKGQ